MKRTHFISLALTLLFATPIWAQLGIQAGTSFSSMKMEMEEDGQKISQDLGNRLSFTGGVFYRLPLQGAFAIQPELNFLQKGGQESFEGTGFNAKTSYIVSFLELPVYFLYTGGNSSGFFAGAGPSFNMGISGKNKIESNSVTNETDLEFGSDKDIKSFHVSINGVAGYQLQNGVGVNAFVSQSVMNSAPESVTNPKMNFLNYGLRVSFLFNTNGSARNSQIKTVF